MPTRALTDERQERTPAAARPKPARQTERSAVVQLQRRLGNRGMARLAARRTIQRKIAIGGKEHDESASYQFSTELSHRLGQRGYSTTARLLKITQSALGRKDIRLSQEDLLAAQDIARDFGSWDIFIDYLADKEYVLAKLPSKASGKRARKLGKRPTWINSLQKARQQLTESRAARHVIPSHFLGYAVEKWPANQKQIEEWVEAATKLRPQVVGDVAAPKHKSLTTLKRYVWQILHNNPGNLWWGDVPDNTTIGFLAPYLESAMKSMSEEAAKGTLDRKVAAEIIGKIPQLKGKSQLSVKWNELHETLSFIGDSDEPEEILENVEDVFLQLELDPSDPNQWQGAVELMDTMENPDPAGKVFYDFFRTTFKGTIQI